MARENGKLPPSQVDSAMPGAGMPVGEQGDEIEIEEEEVETPEFDESMVEVQEDGSVNINFEEAAAEELAAEFDFNLAETLDENVLMEISTELLGNYEEDRESRQDWENSYAEGLKLLGLKYEERDEPFRGSSGVTHPVIAEAVTQFQAQAYKELLPATGPVRGQIVGATNSQVESQAQRVQDFMNYQIMNVMEEYDPELDRLLFYLPLAGSAFKKVYFDDTLDRAVSRFIPADDLVVPYNATDLYSASRVTHVVRMLENEIKKLQNDLKIMRENLKNDARLTEEVLFGGESTAEKTINDFGRKIVEVVDPKTKKQEDFIETSHYDLMKRMMSSEKKNVN